MNESGRKIALYMRTSVCVYVELNEIQFFSILLTKCENCIKKDYRLRILKHFMVGARKSHNEIVDET